MNNKAKERLETGKLAINPQPDMKLTEAIETRRSVRTYQDTVIPVEVVRDILRQCTHAPNACNRKGWRFILIQDPEEFEWLYKRGSAAFVRKAKQAILVSYLSTTDNAVWQDVEQSAAASIAYFQLLAHTRGIGSCWICHLPPKREIKKHFGLPQNFTPIALITFGYYKENLRMLPRVVGDKKILSLNRWQFDEGEGTEAAFGIKFFFKKYVRKIYYLLPKRELFRNYTHKHEKKFHNEEYEE